jgi:hypothetical protein
MLIAVLEALGWAAAPQPIAVTEAESKVLAARDIVVRAGGSGGTTVAFMDLKSTPEKALAAVMDLTPRAGEVSALTRAEPYDALPDKLRPTQMGGAFELTILGSKTRFNINYAIDWDAGWVTYHLDPTKTNDITSSNGSYQVYGVDGGLTRLIYRSEVATSGYVPGWVKEKLTTGSLKDMMRGVRTRAER